MKEEPVRGFTARFPEVPAEWGKKDSAKAGGPLRWMSLAPAANLFQRGDLGQARAEAGTGSGRGGSDCHPKPDRGSGALLARAGGLAAKWR